jgi:hypothetical protein
MKNSSRVPLRLVRLDSTRESLLERIRLAEGDKVITDLAHASIEELRIIARWLDSGKKCDVVTMRPRRRVAEPQPVIEAPALNPIPDTYTKARIPFGERRERLVALSNEYRSDRFARKLSPRVRTLKCRILLAQERMLSLMSSPVSSDSVRKFVRWNRVALRLLDGLRRQQGARYSRTPPPRAIHG